VGDWSTWMNAVSIILLDLITIGHTRALVKVYRRVSNLENSDG